jgi:hypothetical protein
LLHLDPQVVRGLLKLLLTVFSCRHHRCADCCIGLGIMFVLHESAYRNQD